MTKHKIDELFKQKLEGSEFTPSPAAWSTLEDKLHQKRKKGVIFWVSVAASLLLLLTFGWMMLKGDEQIAEQPQLAKTEITPSEVIADSVKSVENTDKDDIEELDQNKEKIDQDRPTERNKTQKSPAKKVKKVAPNPTFFVQQESNLAQNKNEKSLDEGDDMTKENEVVEESHQETSEVADALLENTELLADNTTTEKKGSVKLVYTLKPVITPQSPENEAEAPIEPATKRAFKKALAFAKNVKENPGSLSDLRAAKNSLFNLGSKKKNDSK